MNCPYDCVEVYDAHRPDGLGRRRLAVAIYEITYLRDESRSYLAEAEGFNPQWRR